MSQVARQILIYAGEGAATMNVKALTAQFRALVDSSIRIHEVSSRYIKTENWEKTTLAFAMGGGECSKSEADLGEEGKKKIYDFVASGGNAFGFCAGAYYMSAKSRFALFGKAAIEKERRYPLYSGKAIGPILPITDPLSPMSALAVKVAFNLKDEPKEGLVYYQSGCFFDIEKSTKTIRILGNYSTGKAAAIECDVGKGKAFLFGPHIEFSWNEKLKKVSDQSFARLASVLVPQESFRLQIWEEIAYRLSLPIKSSLL